MVWLVVSLQLGVFGCSFYTNTNGFDTLDQLGHLGSLCILHKKTNGFDTLAPFGHLGSRQGTENRTRSARSLSKGLCQDDPKVSQSVGGLLGPFDDWVADPSCHP